MSQNKEPQITLKQLQEIEVIEGEILAQKESISNCQKIIDIDFDKLTKIFDEIKKTTN